MIVFSKYNECIYQTLHPTFKKTFCNWSLTPEASNDCDKFEHSLTVNVDSAESDKSDDTHTTDVDSSYVLY